MWKIFRSELIYNKIFLSLVYAPFIVYSILLLSGNVDKGNVHNVFGFFLPLFWIMAFFYPVFRNIKEKRADLQSGLPVGDKAIGTFRVAYALHHLLIILAYFLLIYSVTNHSGYVIPVVPIALFMPLIPMILIVNDIWAAFSLKSGWIRFLVRMLSSGMFLLYLYRVFAFSGSAKFNESYFENYSRAVLLAAVLVSWTFILSTISVFTFKIGKNIKH